ncbi:MAG TPA: hypothetical protein VFK80_10580, partial [Limnochordia bacterium]|nr:hypothetical protein [Limnochordia bacterium]
VHYYFSDQSLQYTELRDDGWASLLPTWTMYTDGDGNATAYLYPRREATDLGGHKAIAAGSVEIMAQTQTGMTFNPVKAGLEIGEALFKPVTTSTQVDVERHEPTPWRGKITIDRSADISLWHPRTPSPSQNQGRATVEVAQDWRLKLHLVFDDIQLDRSGAGSGTVLYDLSGTGQGSRTEQVWTMCNNVNPPLKLLTNVTNSKSSLHTQGTLKSDRVALAVDTQGARYVPEFAADTFAEGLRDFKVEKQSHEIDQGCNGQQVHDQTSSYMPLDGFLDQFLRIDPIPVDKWPAFGDAERNATHLTGSVTYTADEQTATCCASSGTTTTVSWDFTRVEPGAGN